MSDIKQQALQCRDAAMDIAQLSTVAKNDLLRAMAAALDADADTILAANARDMDAASAKGVTGAMLDRLKLDAGRLAGIANAVREVADLPDPVGQVTRRDVRPNGIAIERVRVPLGVVAMIYEARPNVTAEAAALCLKAGTGVVLRGGQGRGIAIVGVVLRGSQCRGVAAVGIALGGSQGCGIARVQLALVRDSHGIVDGASGRCAPGALPALVRGAWHRHLQLSALPARLRGRCRRSLPDALRRRERTERHRP